jgi:hypothetical protein
MNLPGFTAEASLNNHAETQAYRTNPDFARFASGVMPQLGFGGDPDFGEYWRCRLNGGPELICRFFGGLPPFSIGFSIAR